MGKSSRCYNSVYASKNNQAICEPDSIQNKFCVLVNQFKPTGNPHIHDAKDSQKLIDNCASVLSLNDWDIEDEEWVFSIFLLGIDLTFVYLVMALELQWQCL
jgi:hypothetical protein